MQGCRGAGTQGCSDEGVQGYRDAGRDAGMMQAVTGGIQGSLTLYGSATQ